MEAQFTTLGGLRKGLQFTTYLSKVVSSRPFVAVHESFVHLHLFVGAACASHGLLDMLTNGGHGVAYFWPWSEHRHFLPAPVIEVSTLNVRRFFGPAGIAVLQSELRWVWLPALIMGLAGWAARRAGALGEAPGGSRGP